MNMQQMMKQAQKMQKQLAQAQDKLGETEVSASAGGGMVKCLESGQNVANQQMSAITGGMNIPGMF